jgi:hypothetical protein
MSKQEDKDLNEKTVTYVYLPDEGIYGTILREGAYYSAIKYYEGGFEYTLEVPNDEFIIVDEIGVGYIDETEENL